MGKQSMPELTAELSRAKTVKERSKMLVLGLQSRLDAAVKVAETSGATKAQLDPLFVLSASLGEEATELAAAVSGVNRSNAQSSEEAT